MLHIRPIPANFLLAIPASFFVHYSSDIPVLKIISVTIIIQFGTDNFSSSLVSVLKKNNIFSSSSVSVRVIISVQVQFQFRQ